MRPLPLPWPSLLTNWPRVLRQAWSIRFSLLAACFTAAEVVLPFLGDILPRGLFVLSYALAAAGSRSNDSLRG